MPPFGRLLRGPFCGGRQIYVIQSAKTAYLQLHSAPCSNLGPPSRELQEALAECANALGIQIWCVPVRGDESFRGLHRHRIFLARRDFWGANERIARVCEDVTLLAELFYGPHHETTAAEWASAFAWRKSFEKGISCSELCDRIDAMRSRVAIPTTQALVHSFTAIAENVTALSWRCARVLEQRPALRFACAFVADAQSRFHVFPGGLDEALYEGAYVPKRAGELASWESSFQSAYKAVEAVIGDPPRDEAKLLSKMRDAGISPDELVGYLAKLPISEVIRKMNTIRDKRAAHGSTRMRGIRMDEMVEFQECARYVVQVAVERAMGVPLFESDR